MSLKLVELQVAIPKTFEAGKVAENHQQNVLNQQLHANEAAKRESERQQSVVLESEDVHGIKDDEEQSNENHQQHKKKKQQMSAKEKAAQHPFKGNLFDFSG